jgi:hypothetical protein
MAIIKAKTTLDPPEYISLAIIDGRPAISYQRDGAAPSVKYLIANDAAYGEILIYDGALSLSEIEAIEQSLNDYWAIY